MAITKYVSEIPYSDVTDNQVQLSTESSIDGLNRSIRDGTDNVLVEYHKEHQGAFGAYDQLRDSLDTLRLKSPYNNLGLDECRLVEVRSTDIKLANTGNIAFNGEVTDVIIVSGGVGYSAAELYTDDTYGSGFKASYTVDSSGIIDSVTVINTGSGYVSPPTLYFTVNSKYTSEASLLPILSSSADTNNKLVLPLQLKDTGVTAGSYTATDITVDSTGRITSASSGSATVTVDSSITDGSTNPVENNAVFDGLALKLDLGGGAMTGAITTNSTFDGVDVDACNTLAVAALPKTGGAMTGAITTNSTFDGVDIATRDGVLTSTTTTANAALPKAGGALTGDITITDTTAPQLKLLYNGTNYAQFEIASTGSLEIETVGAGAADSDITLNADGDINLDALGKITIVAPGYVEFDGCGVGFDLVSPVYNATDTNVAFTSGNKQFVTFGSGNITDLNFKFPTVSGNFTLLLKQDGTGSRLVTNYKAFDSGGSAANGSSTVKFAGGSNPTLTTDANHVDIISFFWDADTEIAYGVATLDFQF